MHAACWQLDWFPAFSGQIRDEMKFVVGRAARTEQQYLETRIDPATPANFQVSEDWHHLERFAMAPARGPLAHLLRWWAGQGTPGIVTIPFFFAALVSGCVAIATRRWSAALVIAGTGGIWAAHVAFLFYHSRYSLPVWVTWYAMPGVLIGLLQTYRLRGREVTSRVDAPATRTPLNRTERSRREHETAVDSPERSSNGPSTSLKDRHRQ